MRERGLQRRSTEVLDAALALGATRVTERRRSVEQYTSVAIVAQVLQNSAPTLHIHFRMVAEPWRLLNIEKK
jgi:hypothetical protein